MPHKIIPEWLGCKARQLVAHSLRNLGHLSSLEIDHHPCAACARCVSDPAIADVNHDA